MLKTMKRQGGATLDIYIKGIKGGDAAPRRNLSAATLECEGCTLTMTSVRDHSRLTETEINISGPSGVLFEGTVAELVSKLSRKR